MELQHKRVEEGIERGKKRYAVEWLTKNRRWTATRWRSWEDEESRESIQNKASATWTFKLRRVNVHARARLRACVSACVRACVLKANGTAARAAHLSVSPPLLLLHHLPPLHLSPSPHTPCPTPLVHQINPVHAHTHVRGAAMSKWTGERACEPACPSHWQLVNSACLSTLSSALLRRHFGWRMSGWKCGLNSLEGTTRLVHRHQPGDPDSVTRLARTKDLVEAVWVTRRPCNRVGFSNNR